VSPGTRHYKGAQERYTDLLSSSEQCLGRQRSRSLLADSLQIDGLASIW